MSGIENRIEFDASPRVVFKHLANPNNVPLFAPGIRDADVTSWTPEGVGTRMTLRTRHGHVREAVITEEAQRRFISIQDDHGVVNEWELHRSPGGGTVAINRILGVNAEQNGLAHDTREKLFAFKDFVETRNGHSFMVK